MKRQESCAVVGSICVLALLLAAVGCGGGSALNPAFQPQVSNQTDNFQFQSTGVNNVTQTLQYTWQNTGTGASINQATVMSSGTAFITLKDAKSNAVYSADLRANGTFTSVQGTPGNWTIVIVLNGVSGTLNFRVQKM